jgi:hypothetical protein
VKFRSRGQGSDRDVVVIAGGGRVGYSGGGSAGCDGEGRGGWRGESERQAGGRGSPPLRPANGHVLDPAAARHRRDTDGTRRTGRRGTALGALTVHRGVCGGSATRRKGRGCENLRARAEATEARDASNNGASQPFVTSMTRRPWANSLTVSG